MYHSTNFCNAISQPSCWDILREPDRAADIVHKYNFLVKLVVFVAFLPNYVSVVDVINSISQSSLIASEIVT